MGLIGYEKKLHRTTGTVVVTGSIAVEQKQSLLLARHLTGNAHRAWLPVGTPLGLIRDARLTVGDTLGSYNTITVRNSITDRLTEHEVVKIVDSLWRSINEACMLLKLPLAVPHNDKLLERYWFCVTRLDAKGMVDYTARDHRLNAIDTALYVVNRYKYWNPHAIDAESAKHRLWVPNEVYTAVNQRVTRIKEKSNVRA